MPALKPGKDKDLKELSGKSIQTSGLPDGRQGFAESSSL
jgi:hypothetical protein